MRPIVALASVSGLLNSETLTSPMTATIHRQSKKDRASRAQNSDWRSLLVREHDR
jgi:hypothetical protein